MPLTDAHLQALGRITVNFSTLEFTLLAMLSGLVEPEDHGVGQIVGAHFLFARLLTVVSAPSTGDGAPPRPRTSNDSTRSSYARPRRRRGGTR